MAEKKTAAGAKTGAPCQCGALVLIPAKTGTHSWTCGHCGRAGTTVVVKG